MPRSARINIPGGIYHVITRGLERKKIFRNSSDYKEFLSRLEYSLKKTDSHCYAWVLMSNHFHLMIKTGTGSLSDIMRSLLTGYAVYFNKKYNRHGYLYQNRYKSVLCQEDVYFLELVRYIHLNPLRASIVKEVKELVQYEWSGHGAILGKCKMQWQDVESVLSMFGCRGREARRRYKHFIEAGATRESTIDFRGGGLVRSAGGWQNVLKMRRKKQKQEYDERILGGNDFVNKVLQTAREKRERRDVIKEQGWDINHLAQRVCDIFHLSVDDLRKRGRTNNISMARKLFCYWGNKELEISGKELADYLGISRPSVCGCISAGALIKTHKLIN